MAKGKEYKQARNIAKKKAAYQKRISEEIEQIKSLKDDVTYQIKDHKDKPLMCGLWLSGKQWKEIFKVNSINN